MKIGPRGLGLGAHLGEGHRPVETVQITKESDRMEHEKAGKRVRSIEQPGSGEDQEERACGRRNKSTLSTVSSRQSLEECLGARGRSCT